MSEYWVRVELHRGGAPVQSSEYAALHESMESVGFKRKALMDGITFDLPTAEYVTANRADIDALSTLVNGAVRLVLRPGQTFQALVGELKGCRSIKG